MSRKGRCAICGVVGALTADHVPPSSVVPPRAIEIRLLADTIGSIDKPAPPRPGRNAPIFETLCSSCNTARLGAEFDPALARFVNGFSSWIRSAFVLGLSLPSVARVSIQPALVARAVIGHVLAAEPDRAARLKTPVGTMLRDMRAYFLSRDLALPPELELLIWPFPADRIIIGRGFSRLEVGSGSIAKFEMLKFFPVAFVLMGTSAKRLYPSVSRVRPEVAETWDASVEIDIPLRPSPGPGWPELPGDDGVVCVSSPRMFVADLVGSAAP